MKNTFSIIGVFLLMLAFSIGSFSQNVNQELTDMRMGLKEVQDVQEGMLYGQLQSRIQKVINTSEFVGSANVSLNALVLSNSLTDYLNNVSDLNNPTNKDLGFSLVKSVEELVDQEIFQGRKRAGGAGRGKFLQILNNILEMPLTKTITSTIPVVSSLTSISQMVTSTVLEDKNLSARDLEDFRDRLGVYVAHYEGLARATHEFDIKISVLSERTLSVQLMLRNFAYQRIGALDAEVVKDDMLKEYSLRKILLDHYDQSFVRKKVNQIVEENTVDGKLNYQAILAAEELDYPDFVINEARFILDEIETISQEYLASFDDYQKSLEQVLQHSKDIGDSEKIDRKIEELRKKLIEVEMAFLNAVHVEEVKRKFEMLVETERHVGEI
jgi:hypothetical protein